MPTRFDPAKLKQQIEKVREFAPRIAELAEQGLTLRTFMATQGYVKAKIRKTKPGNGAAAIEQPGDLL